MKYIPFILLLVVLSCSINSDYITQTETKTVNNNGVQTKVSITKKLRKIDRLPVSIHVKAKYSDSAYESMDSFLYDSNGKTTVTKSFVRNSGEWKLVKSTGVEL
ncbi:hypothetical protein [Niabella hibiscisoli]|uniref:hypothetical protein n=1 Tax=Niabella hibiscisoli TaxID=1825928 RepID=UPI001F0E28B8|nr:hypothetical protein [Niabella hibiscisoli]MCH5715995.1 hypothetical protein [Niabella hibiscisoli]